MKTRYKYINFVKTEQKPKTAVWRCHNNRSGAELGEVRWYAPWRQYCYFPTCPAVYSDGCLQDIQEFIAQADALPGDGGEGGEA